MRKFLLILIFLYFGCDNPFTELEEQSSIGHYIDYMEEAWVKFEEGDYSAADSLFSTCLLTNSYEHFNSAYIGLGWTSLYLANIEISDTAIMNNYRINASMYFDSASVDINGALEEYAIDVASFQFDKDLIVGQAFELSYQAFHATINGEIPNLDTIITKTDEIIVLDSNYVFISESKFSTTVIDEINIESYLTINDIYILRAQTFIKQNDFVSANVELKRLNISGCNELDDTEYQKIIECIDSF